MPRIIRTTIDPNGNLSLDLEGYVGEDCVAEERRLRDGLAALGLVVEASLPRRKAAQAGRDTRVET